ncbi:TYR-PHOSPHATASE-2 domain-containing protein [Mycena chlorophos]|uniref:TYR-PHOSPHATASE-2 domain-containing protein n=1 Tax=Mycena chlorophos TaxID=658473 RepID=A0A8H6S0I7_MYCCL|nr:TYR-PHOSPHATASE-2 domain-containing protein [Mycena chlorophos]
MAAPVLPILPPPFVHIEGLVNMRAVGGFTAPKTKPIILYRCADPSRITPKGKEQFAALGIRDVFDFRADDEIASYQTPAPDVPGVKFHRTPVSESRAFDPVSLAARMSDFASDERGMFVQMNHEILETAGPAFEKVFRYMVEHPEEPCMIHCTVGKDRTGIFTALTLNLLGVPDEEIAAEYGLTTEALKPVLPIMVARFKERVGHVDNWDDLAHMISSDPANMLAILEMLRDKYGGAEGWILSQTSLTTEDVSRFRSNYLV